MRDKIKDKQYFEDLLKEEEKNIKMFKSAVQKRMKEKGEADRGVHNGYSILINSYQNLVNLLYSCGADLKTIEDCYKEFLPYYNQMWNRKYGYIELVKVLSLAVLFEIDKGCISELEERLRNDRFDDFLVNVLIKTVDPSWENQGTEFEFPGIYDDLKAILDNKESEQIALLKNYLQNQWYNIHKECSWFNSHLFEHNNYYGYWSFEAGAVAKILHLDDSSLKDVPYYPYDLVHYKE